MRTLTMNEVQDVNGGILGMSSALGHLGRAFSAGYVIGSAIDWLANVGDSSGDSPFQYGA